MAATNRILPILIVALSLSSPVLAAPPNCDTLLKQTKTTTNKAARSWNAFIEAFNKYAFQPDYSNNDNGMASLRAQITEIRSLSANASGFIAQAAQLNCKIDAFQPSQTAIQDINAQLDRAVLQLSN